MFDQLIAGNILGPETLAQMLALVPLPGAHGAGTAIAGGMGVYSDQASRHGRNYGHGGGGPGYDLDAAVFPDTPIGECRSRCSWPAASVNERETSTRR